MFFHPGVSQAQGVHVLTECEHVSGVIRVGWRSAGDYGIVYTTFFGLNSPSQAAPLHACLNRSLRRSRLVASQGWPD